MQHLVQYDLKGCEMNAGVFGECGIRKNLLVRGYNLAQQEEIVFSNSTKDRSTSNPNRDYGSSVDIVILTFNVGYLNVTLGSNRE